MEHIVYWDNGSYDSFLYGTSLTNVGRSIFFKNRIVPPGESLKTWVSRTNYQRNRITPSLPLLKKGVKYYLTLSATIYPKNSIYIKISFFNRFDEEISSQVLRKMNNDFIYPDTAYSYKIELFNASCEEFLFHHILIYDNQSTEKFEGDWNPLSIHHIKNSDYESDTLYIVFMEQNYRTFSSDERLAFNSFGEMLIVGDYEAIDSYYLLPDFAKYFDKIIKNFSSKKFYFIGYGPISNFAASYYSCEYVGSKAFVTDQFYSASFYQSRLDKLGIVEHQADFILERVEYGKNVTSYGKTKDPILSIFDSLYFPIFRLNELFRDMKEINYEE